MRCPKCNYRNLDGATVCNLCGEILHLGGASAYKGGRRARKRPGPPPASGGGMAQASGQRQIEVSYAIVCFPLDPVKLEKSKVYEIGRAKSCTIILPVGMVSRHHARIEWNGRAFVVKDLGSRHGTYVNGEGVRQHELRNRDVVKIGPYALEFYIYSGDTRAFTQMDRELEKTADITIGDPTQNINSFRGNIAEMNLGEILQLLNLTRKSGDLEVKSRGKTGTIFIRGGEIMDAVIGRKKGEDAIGKIIRVHEGTYRFTLNEEPVEKVIYLKTSRLLVEALRAARKRD
jgi:pSer/pThr/pTyr-binding forkhead associated (FHA) protein